MNQGPSTSGNLMPNNFMFNFKRLILRRRGKEA